MTELHAILAAIMTVLQSHPLCSQVTLLETKEYSADQFFVKLRAIVSEGYRLQVRIYHNRGHIDYAYQLIGDRPLLRWDNKEEFRQLGSYPHHHHDEGNIKPSPLSGDPLRDLPIVLQALTKFLNRKSC